MLNFGGLSRLAAIGALAVLGCLAGAPAAKALYDVEPGEIPGRPGTIIRIWPLESGGPGLKANANAFRFLYRSTGLNGEPIPVSGAIFIPDWSRAGRRTQHHRLGASDLRRGAALRAVADA